MMRNKKNSSFCINVQNKIKPEPAGLSGIFIWLRKSYGQFISALFLTGVMSINPVLAEYPVVRSGTFLTVIPTGQCDGIVDTIEGIGEFVIDGIEYLGEKTIETTVGFGTMVGTGNPDVFLDSVNSTFADLGSATGAVLAYSPLGLMSKATSILPDGAVTDLLKTGTKFVADTQASIASEAVNGLNPIAIADTAINDLGEIAGDIANVLVNLDDPLSAGSELLNLTQKWNIAGSLTYILTEDDPLTGMKKALQAMQRQVEIITTYGGGIPLPTAKISSALLAHSLKQSKVLIDSLPDGDEKVAASLYVAAFAASFAQTINDPNFVPNESRHPLFSAEIRDVNAKWLGNDHNTGGDYDHGFLHPVVEDKPGCINLGDNVYNDGIKETLKAVCQVESGRDVWWSRPIDYEVVWGDNCSGGTHDRSVWKPVCKDGYVSVGFVASGNVATKPLPNQIACLKNDPNILGVVSGNHAGLEWIANDDGSGAKFFNLTAYNRKFLGMDLMYAVNASKPRSDAAYVASLEVAVEAAGIAPNNSKAHCVNFYSEPNFQGSTHEACATDTDTVQNLEGQWGQMRINGISSFQCGEKVAGIEVYSSTGSKIINCGLSQYMNDFDRYYYKKAKILSSFQGLNGVIVKSPKAITDQFQADRNAARIADEESKMSSTLSIEYVDPDTGILSLGAVSVSPGPKLLGGIEKYIWGDTLTFTATPSKNAYFVGWAGDAALSCGTSLICSLKVMEGNSMVIKPSFRAKPKLTVYTGKKGTVSLSASSVGEKCLTSSICYIYPNETSIVMTATATNALYDFDRWEGDNDCKDGNLVMNQNLLCKAIFKRNTYQLSITPDSGSSVTSNPSGLINCGNSNTDCSEDYAVGASAQNVELIATLSPNKTFVRWDGYFDCYDDDPDNNPLTTTVTAGNDKDMKCNVVTVDEGTEYALTVEKNAGGVVTAVAQSGADSLGIDCGVDACTQKYPVNELVHLTAEATRGSEFTGFSTQADSTIYRGNIAQNVCYDGQLTMTKNVTCIAAFRSSVLVIDGSRSDASKEQNPYLSVLRQFDSLNVDIWDVKSPSATSNPVDLITGVQRKEPNAEDLAPYGRVIWYSGDTSTLKGAPSPNPLAGPSLTAETHLGEYLDAGGCFMLSSPQYYYDRGLTPFMQNYLGVASITENTGETDPTYTFGTRADGTFGVLTGLTGSFDPVSSFSNRGPYALSPTDAGIRSIINDTLTHNPDVPGSQALMHYADSSEAAVGVDNGRYRTAFLAYPFLALKSGNDRIGVMDAFMDYCGKAESDDLFEANNSFSQATPISGITSLQDMRILANDSDYFSWVANGYTDARITLSFRHDWGNLSLEVYDSTQTLIKTSEGLNGTEVIDITNIDDGQTYFIRVFGVVDASNMYKLDIISQGESDRDHDGVPDVNDAKPEDASEQFDADRDFIGDNRDLDDDNDGLTDIYELQYGLNPLLADDATEDKDGDGYSNIEEYYFGSDPTNRDSIPVVPNKVETETDTGTIATTDQSSSGGGGGSLSLWGLLALLLFSGVIKISSKKSIQLHN